MLALTPDLLYLVSGATDNKLVIWSWSTMSLTQVNAYSVGGTVNAAAIIAATYAGSRDPKYLCNGWGITKRGGFQSNSFYIKRRLLSVNLAKSDQIKYTVKPCK
jgi:hypothetical protein